MLLKYTSAPESKECCKSPNTRFRHRLKPTCWDDQERGLSNPSQRRRLLRKTNQVA